MRKFASLTLACCVQTRNEFRYFLNDLDCLKFCIPNVFFTALVRKEMQVIYCVDIFQCLYIDVIQSSHIRT